VPSAVPSQPCPRHAAADPPRPCRAMQHDTFFSAGPGNPCPCLNPDNLLVPGSLPRQPGRAQSTQGRSLQCWAEQGSAGSPPPIPGLRLLSGTPAEARSSASSESSERCAWTGRARAATGHISVRHRASPALQQGSQGNWSPNRHPCSAKALRDAGTSTPAQGRDAREAGGRHLPLHRSGLCCQRPKHGAGFDPFLRTGSCGSGHPLPARKPSWLSPSVPSRAGPPLERRGNVCALRRGTGTDHGTDHGTAPVPPNPRSAGAGGGHGGLCRRQVSPAEGLRDACSGKSGA